eukprot:7504956-Pyramimonas_sp.AAC.1
MPTLSSFDMPVLSQETPVRSIMRPNFAVPGPALEGPAKPSTFGNGLPIDCLLYTSPSPRDRSLS